MLSTPLARALLTTAGVVLIIAPVFYAAGHPLTARLTVIFIGCWLLAALCLLASYPRNADGRASEPGDLDNG